MTPLHSLITALIRLLGLYYIFNAVDNAAAPLFALITQISLMPADAEMQFPNPWVYFLPAVAYYIVLAALLFFLAPKLARWMIGREANEEAKVPWNETLLFCTGAMILSWAFVRLTNAVHSMITNADRTDGHYTLNNAQSVYLFMTAILLAAGVLLIAKFHRISAWIAARRASGDSE